METEFENEKTGEVVSGDDILEFELSNLRAKHANLEIDGIDDKKGYKAVVSALTDYTRQRTWAKTIHKEMKADIIKAGKKVDKKYKEVLELILVDENILREKRKVIDDVNNDHIAECNSYLRAIEDQKQAEIERIELDQQEMCNAYWKYENARLDDINENQRIEAERIQAEKDLIEAEKLKLQAEKDLIEAERIENQRIEAGRIQAEKDREIAKNRANEIELEKAKIELETQKRKESLKPDLEKMQDFANILSGLRVPELKDVKAQSFMINILGEIIVISEMINEKVGKYS